jgi:hypothetical protein
MESLSEWSLSAINEVPTEENVEKSLVFPDRHFSRGKGLYKSSHRDRSWGYKIRENTHIAVCVFSQMPSISDWSGSTGHSSYTAFNVHYMGL